MMRQSTWALLVMGALSVAALGGCQSKPFCLNCVPGGNGDGGGGDGGNNPDLRGKDGGPGVDQGPDLSGPCEPTNGGVEKCDGLDNDCNGVADDVLPEKLAADPNNCGACGNVCDFIAQKQFGACVEGAGGVPTCQPSDCLPGFIDLDPDVPGCEYQCTPTNPATEICDGIDNDCDGDIDEGFVDSAGKYTVSVDNCGACGTKCLLPGAINKCEPGGDGLGHCAVDTCINDGTLTFKHDPAAGDLNTTGCEYKCPVPSTTVTAAGEDCNSVDCDFPPELCDGIDNDCNFLEDDDPTDLVACGQNCPGGLATNCVGECKVGTYVCAGGVRVCPDSMGPTAEVCDGLDNNCNGTIDDPFVKPGTGVGATAPVYSVDTANCGGCGMACNLANAANGCHETATNSGIAECYVKTCNNGFAFPTRTTAGQCTSVSGTLAPTVMTGNQNGAGGLGCYYSCPAKTREYCDGKDNDCDGCLDNSNAVAPALDAMPDKATFCKQVGECSLNGGVNPICANRGTATATWKCDYAGAIGGGAALCLDAAGNLTSVESGCTGSPTSFCDAKDNNCNGRIDEGLALYEECTLGATRTGGTCNAGRWTCSGATCSSGFTCSGGFCVAACTAGVGACAATGAKGCGGTPGAALVCSATANTAAAANEACDGIDNDCDGLTDERDDNTGAAPIKCSGNNCLGYRDPMVQVQPRACTCTGNAQCPVGYTCAPTGAPFAGRCVEGAGSPQACAHPTQATADAQCTGGGSNRCTNLGSAVYVYQYEASRPGATSGSAGVDNTDPTKRRACARANTMPWTNVLQADAAAACALIRDSANNPMRLCTEAEWQASCVGSTRAADPQWSLQSNPQTFANGANQCNAENPAGAVRATGPASNTCSSTFTGGGQIFDLSGNVIEWTSTSVTSGMATYYRMRGGAFNSPRVGASCEYSFNLGQDDYLNSNVGFRCCSNAAP